MLTVLQCPHPHTCHVYERCPQKLYISHHHLQRTGGDIREVGSARLPSRHQLCHRHPGCDSGVSGGLEVRSRCRDRKPGPPPPPVTLIWSYHVQPLRVECIRTGCVRSGVRLLILNMGTWGFSLGEAKQRKWYTS